MHLMGKLKLVVKLAVCLLCLRMKWCNTNFLVDLQYIRCLFYSIIIIISIQPEGRFWQEPEPSQATGMALAHCSIEQHKFLVRFSVLFAPFLSSLDRQE
jgi:hypothetical protein